MSSESLRAIGENFDDHVDTEYVQAARCWSGAHPRFKEGTNSWGPIFVLAPYIRWYDHSR